MDLCKLETIRDFARSYLESKKPLHILINNAGVMAIEKREFTNYGNEVYVFFFFFFFFFFFL